MKEPVMSNYDLLLETSMLVVDKMVKNSLIKIFQKLDEPTKLEMWNFIKPFRVALANSFGIDEKKHGFTHEVMMPKSMVNTLKKNTFEKLCSEISKVFGITAQFVTKKDIPFNAENLKSSLSHIPLLIAYELTEEQMANILSNVGDTANIIWIKVEE